MARAARERSEQERETMGLGATTMFNPRMYSVVVEFVEHFGELDRDRPAVGLLVMLGGPSDGAGIALRATQQFRADFGMAQIAADPGATAIVVNPLAGTVRPDDLGGDGGKHTAPGTKAGLDLADVMQQRRGDHPSCVVVER